MSEDKKEGGQPDATDFDLQLELSSLVADQVIPQSIAEKLEKKLVEKQVDITKDQLYALAEKIHNLIQTYKEKGSLPEPTRSTDSVKPNKQQDTDSNDELKDSSSSHFEGEIDDETIEGFMSKIGQLQQKIDELEQQGIQGEVTDKNQSSSYNDINLPYNESISTSHLTTDPLQNIPSNPESIIVLMNWLQYLVNRCGHDNLANVLDYYVEVDWITDDVKISLLEYATGITEGNNLKSDTSNKGDGKSSNLHSKDHIQSYLYIQRLKGKKFEKHFVERINGELARIEKKVDTYHHTQ